MSPSDQAEDSAVEEQHRHLAAMLTGAAINVRDIVDRRLTPVDTSLATIKTALAELARSLREPAMPDVHRPSARTVLAQVMTCHALSAIRSISTPAIAAEYYRGDVSVLQALADPGGYVRRAVTNPAMTTVATWAAELVGTANAAVLPQIAPQSIYAQLSARGIRASLGAAGQVRIVSHAPSPNSGGAFVGEGQPIPVVSSAIGAATLTPRTCAIISTFTREIAAHSTPSIEDMLRRNMAVDTGSRLDSVLLDAVAADAIRPAGLRAGVAGLTATPGGGLDALMGDVKALVAAIEATGSIVDPVFICSQSLALQIGLLAPNSVLPVISSATAPVNTLIALDSADFCSAEGDAVDFSVSDAAVLHESDAPLPLVAGGSPASPSRSLWQTASFGLRLMLDLDWCLSRSGRISWVENVTW